MNKSIFALTINCIKLPNNCTFIHNVDPGAHQLTKCNPIDNEINSNWNAYK